MNKRFTTYIGSFVFALSTLLAATALSPSAHAALPGQVGDAPRCTVESVGPRASAFKVAGNDATVSFKVTGGDNCKVQVSTNSFYAPSLDGRPYEAQILYQRITKIYSAPGTYSITAGLPPKSTEAKGCFYQVDLTYGTHNITPVLAYGHGKLDCSKPQTPAYACVSLKVEEISRTQRKFIATATATGGATIEKYEFGFGDGMGITVSNNTYTYDYKKTGTFKTNVVVHVKVDGAIKKVTSTACEVNVTILDEKIEACPLNPSLPKNSPDCQPCPIPGKENLPKGSPDCKEAETPQVLAATGPTDIALGGLGLSSLTAAGYYWRASRNRLISKLLGR